MPKIDSPALNIAHFATLLSAAALLIAGSALATPTTALPPTSAQPSTGRVQGPPDGIIPPPRAGERQLPLPFPANTAPSTTPTPAPAPATAAPTSRAPAIASPTSRSRPAPAARAPVTTAPSGYDTPDYSNDAQTSSLPIDAPVTPLPDISTPQEAEAVSPAFAWPEWAPLAAIGGVAALIFALLLWWPRRRKRALALPTPEASAASTAPTPTPAPPPVPTPKPVTPRPILGRRAELSMAFEALAAQSTLVNFRLRYAITLTNSGPVDAAAVTLRIGLFAGTQASESGIAGWLMLPDQGAHHQVESITAGADFRFEGELAAPLDALGPMTVDGRTLAIALMAVDARYHHGAGETLLDGQVARAFVVGREPPSTGGPSAKLAPFRLDQGPTSFAPLGSRDTGISRNE